MIKTFKNLSRCKTGLLWLLGGIIYYEIEMIYRGYSHWTMVILGGLCFVLIGSINEIVDMPLFYQMLISSFIITILEFLAGLLLNVWLGLGIWDYSGLAFNFMGQICLPYMIIWFFLSLLGILLDDVLRNLLFNEQKNHYRFIKW